MATQHPDNASHPYWKTNGDAFISSYDEVFECYLDFAELGCEEYMWDWEGSSLTRRSLTGFTASISTFSFNASWGVMSF
jgi:phosphoenolpyruvate carboxylase